MLSSTDVVGVLSLDGFKKDCPWYIPMNAPQWASLEPRRCQAVKNLMGYQKKQKAEVKVAFYFFGNGYLKMKDPCDITQWDSGGGKVHQSV